MIQSDISIILVAPQMGENIGASARAMKNFGIRDLRLVAPRDGWPNDKAASMSAHAVDIIKSARIYNDIKSAIADLDFIYATTAAQRDMNKQYVLSRNIVDDLPPMGSKVGFLFGRESSGLSNDEITYANKIVTIDTEGQYSSLNLAHAVAVICYELFQRLRQDRADLKIEEQRASMAELEHFYDRLFMELDRRKFFRVPEKKEYMSQKIRNLFSRIDNLSKSELQTLRGIVTVLTKNEKM
jgi:tRNA/rRNA methyltransferase